MRGLLLIVIIMLGVGALCTEAQQPYSGVTIEHWTFLNPEGDKPRERALREIIKKFEKKTGIKVKLQVLPWNQIDIKAITAVYAGNPPDVTRVNIRFFEKRIAADSLMPLNQYADRAYTAEQKKDFLTYEQLMRDGNKYTFFLVINPYALYIRKDLLDKAGMESPTTWCDFILVGRALTKDERPGYLFPGSKVTPNQMQVLFQPIIHGRGGRILDDTGKAVFNEEKEGIQTYAYLVDLVHKYGVVPKEVVGMAYDDVTDAFAGGTVAMIYEGAHRYTRIVNSLGKEKVLLAKLPSPPGMPPSPSILTGWNIGIPRGAAHPDAAWEFIKYYTSNEAQGIYATIAGGIPTRRSTLKLPFFETEEMAHIRWWLNDYVAQSSEVILHIPKVAELTETMTEALQELILNPKLSIQEVLSNAASRYNRIAGAEE
jgi:multiple sugar transport system substrate-binding protein